MRIGIAYNLKDELSPDAIIDGEHCEEFDTPHTITAICDVLEKNGYETVRLGGGIGIADRIKGEKVDFVFNIAEGHYGRNRESHIPAILEMLNVPYSGSDPLTLGLTLDKIMAKKLAFCAGIPTPRHKIVRILSDINSINGQLRYPLITKPAWEGSSKGIYNSSKVFHRSEIEKNVRFLLDRYPDQPVLVEEYIEGKEITVGVIGNNPPKILGLMEIVNKTSPGEDIFYSLETKRNWKELIDYLLPPDINQIQERHIEHYAMLAFNEFGCRDVARMDFRISKHNNKVFLLEVNPLPGLSPEYADLVIMVQKQGLKYEDLILSILDNAFLRYKNAKNSLSHEKI